MASPRVAVAHADWLTLVDPHGPFLTLPVLRAAWPNGLDRTPTGPRGELRSRIDVLGTADAERRGFADWVLRRLLGYGPYLRSGQQIPDAYTVTLPEHGETLRPDWVVAPDNNGATGTARLLASFWPAATDFSAHVPDSRWTASPSDRMVALCRATGVELGLVTDGARWQLVWAGTGAVGRATWSATIFAEAAERTLLDSFTSVLGARRLFSVAADQTLETLLAASADAHAEVTTTLGRQVRQAVELLVAAFSRANREVGGELLAGIDPHTVYEAAVSVMMRLVFLLYAEERRLLPLGEDLYDSAYAVSTLRQRLRDIADTLGDEQALEYRQSAWPRLLATFRAVWGGLAHDELRVPAYGGRFFDPDSYPFLEGRRPGQSWRDVPGEPLPVDDRTVLAVLTALQVLQIREGGVTEARRLSFRSLDVEQIGHVYEGLLDHGARRVDETTVGLIGKPGYEPEVALSSLMRAAAGEGPLEAWRLSAWIAEHTGLTPKKIAALLDNPLDDNRSRLLLAACEGDQVLHGRLAPFAFVMRDDLRGLPTVIPAGAIYVTEVSHRRDSGTEYTTRELAEEVARYTLEPLVYSPGPADGAEPADWKPVSSERILALRVCDPAVGSGAILTAACRYLADHLVVAWTAEDNLPLVADALADDDVDDVVIEARRAVAERCLYGVDRDPMAVEMAKLSLWLVTMAKDRPFSFLDHALQAGDSLLGVTSLDQVAQFHIDPAVGRKRRSGSLFDYTGALKPLIDRATDLRRQIEEAPVRDVRDAEEKHRLLSEATGAMEAVRVVADLVVGAALSTASAGKGDLDYRLDATIVEVAEALDPELDDTGRAERIAGLDAKAQAWLNARRPSPVPIRHPLHWPLVFPEVMGRENGGFDAFVGNPPFLGRKYWLERLGPDWEGWAALLLGEAPSKIDACVLFFRRSFDLLRSGGTAGLIATSSITEGNSSRVALGRIKERGTIYRALSKRPWPGAANVDVAIIWFTPAEYHGIVRLDDEPVDEIGANLTAHVVSEPSRLVRGLDGFIGSNNVAGDALILRKDDPWVTRLAGCPFLRPYVTGEDITKRGLRNLDRMILDCGDLSLEEVRRQCPEAHIFLTEVVAPNRTPESLNRYKGLGQRWWQIWSHNAKSYADLRSRRECLAIPVVSKYVVIAVVPTEWCFTNKVILVPLTRPDLYAILSSTVFDIWARRFSGTTGQRVEISMAGAMHTFPLPEAELPEAMINKWRQAIEAAVLQFGAGYTAVWNALAGASDLRERVDNLKDVFGELDAAVLRAYGVDGQEMDYGVHETPHGPRFTVGAKARQELLERLVEANHEQYSEEIRLGFHDKKKPTAKRKVSARAAAPSQLHLSDRTLDPEGA